MISIYPTELQVNKANTSDKETSFPFLALNIKVIGSDVHTSVYDKRDDFGFPIVNSPWLSGDVPRFPSYGVYISQLVRLVEFHSKNIQITSKLLTQGYRYHKLRKTFGKFFVKIWWNIVSRICFGRNLSSDLLRWSSLQTKEDQMWSEFVLSGSKIVKRLRRRKYDPVIIEGTIGLLLGTSTALYSYFLKYCTD